MESTRRYSELAVRFSWWASVLLLLARAWQYIYWDSPLRVLVWDEDAFSGIVTQLGWSWSDWVTSERVGEWISQWTVGLGIVLLLGVLALIYGRFLRWNAVSWAFLFASVLVLLFHAILETKGHYWRIGHLAELSLQWATPLLFWLMVRHGTHYKLVDYALRISIALTFIGHGLYAYGYYPVPGHFQQMMISGFGVDNQQALFLLKMAGILDFLAAGLIFVPLRRVRETALFYIIIWGFLTALARIWSHADSSSVNYLFTHWIPQFCVRSEHFLIPMALFLWWRGVDSYIAIDNN